MKVCFLSDAHLFQSYVKEYNSIPDFKKALRAASQEDPDMYILAGDMFDYKKSATSFLRHYEGEGFMVKIRKFLSSLDKPVYTVLGNHEKPEVLKGLDQTVENFHYKKGRNWVEINNLNFLLMDTHYQPGGYKSKEIEKTFKEVCNESKGRSNPVMVMHETLAPFKGGIPNELIKKVSENFEWVFNGHMHYFDPKTLDLKGVITLPSLLPSQLVYGKYWTERYSWPTDRGSWSHKSRPSPFGFVVFDSSKGEVKMSRITPSKKTVEVHLSLSGLSLKESRNRFRDLLKSLNSRDDKENLMVYPSISGELTFSPHFLKDIPEEFPRLLITKTREGGIERRAPPIKGAETTVSMTSPENLQDEILEIKSDILKVVNEKLDHEIKEKMVEDIIVKITRPDSKFLRGSKPKVVKALRGFVEENSKTLRDIEGIKKPEKFASHLKELAEGVKR